MLSDPVVLHVVQDATKHKQSGPYKKKECKLFLMQMGPDGEKRAFLGNAVLDLAEIAGPVERTVEIPVDCDADIKRAVGRPKLILRCRYGHNVDDSMPEWFLLNFVYYFSVLHSKLSSKRFFSFPWM